MQKQTNLEQTRIGALTYPSTCTIASLPLRLGWCVPVGSQARSPARAPLPNKPISILSEPRRMLSLQGFRTRMTGDKRMSTGWQG